MSEDIVVRVGAIQNFMAEPARSSFEPGELDHLCCLIRLTVESHQYLQRANAAPLSRYDLRYLCESIFSGVDSFQSVTRAYHVLVGATESRLEWPPTTLLLTRQFLSMFGEFEVEQRWPEKCRLLLDLFKMQLAFAAGSYD